MAGLLTFAWPTGVMMSLAQDFQDTQMQLLKQKRERRRARLASTHPPETSPSK